MRVFTREHREKLSKARTGQVMSDETKERLSTYAKEVGVHPPHLRGKDNPNWNGRPTTDSIRKSVEYLEWKYAVIKRDDYTCVWCGIKSRKIHVDHIKSFASYPELRFDVSNGRVLCIPCHKKTDTWGRHI